MEAGVSCQQHFTSVESSWLSVAFHAALNAHSPSFNHRPSIANAIEESQVWSQNLAFLTTFIVEYLGILVLGEGPSSTE
jgi:hypothetical protein